MRIPLNLPTCDKCGAENYAWVNLHDDSIEYRCSCGEDFSGSISDITVGYRALYRSEYELLKNNDYSLSIVFSAAAFEWELRSLHNKWLNIEYLSEGKEISDKELDDIFRKNSRIVDKITAAGKMLYPEGVERFVTDRDELKKIIEEGYPSLTINDFINSIKEQLFWPRNRIIHSFYSEYDRPTAIKCYNVARLGLFITHSMDQYKRNEGRI